MRDISLLVGNGDEEKVHVRGNLNADIATSETVQMTVRQTDVESMGTHDDIGSPNKAEEKREGKTRRKLLD
jgi:hypothetical protein